LTFTAVQADWKIAYLTFTAVQADWKIGASVEQADAPSLSYKQPVASVLDNAAGVNASGAWCVDLYSFENLGKICNSFTISIPQRPESSRLIPKYLKFLC